ncbi:MAG: NAD(+)/NADH kinase [Solirubrobacteraceae bacterium]
MDQVEAEKHGLAQFDGLNLVSDTPVDADICFALGGDGTILRALRTYAGTGVPVFAVNFGEFGFLATADANDYRADFEKAFAGEFEVMALPGLRAQLHGGTWTAFNDVSVQRRQGQRVANLSYEVADDIIGNVRCDGLVVATPAGSTGYNLANGGPVMAWGVEGMVVSFIAPHALTARSVVVAPADVLTIENSSQEEEADVVYDGRPLGVLHAGEALRVSFVNDQGLLAQLDGMNFYRRLRQKFGRLATLR